MAEGVASRLDDEVTSLSAFRRVGMELRPVEVEGGGDLSLGERGQCGEVSPDFVNLSVRELSSIPSTLAGCKGGLFADRALWTAAADGTDGKDPFNVADLVGLNS